MHADIITLLLAGGTGFTPADLKAYLGMESADYTNVEIEGNQKTEGVITHHENVYGFKGLAQMNTDAAAAASKWAEDHGVSIPWVPANADNPGLDPRYDAQKSFILAAAYVGRVAEILRGSRTIRSLEARNRMEFKKLVIAGYNGGPTNVIRAVDSYVAANPNRAELFTWEDLKSQNNISGQMREYVVGTLDSYPDFSNAEKYREFVKRNTGKK